MVCNLPIFLTLNRFYICYHKDKFVVFHVRAKLDRQDKEKSRVFKLYSISLKRVLRKHTMVHIVNIRIFNRRPSLTNIPFPAPAKYLSIYFPHLPISDLSLLDVDNDCYIRRSSFQTHISTHTKQCEILPISRCIPSYPHQNVCCFLSCYI